MSAPRTAGVATSERRRPAAGRHPLAAVPAATCARIFPGQPLGRGSVSDVVHALVDGQPMCRLRVRRITVWDGTPPLRLCSLCAQAVTARTVGPAWSPTRPELAELHLHAADSLLTAIRERLADIRSSAIADGSALVPVEQLPIYRDTRGVPVGEPLPPLRAAVILGQLLDRISPAPVIVSAAEEARAAAAAADDAAERQRTVERASVATAERRQDLRAARQARRTR